MSQAWLCLPWWGCKPGLEGGEAGLCQLAHAADPSVYGGLAPGSAWAEGRLLPLHTTRRPEVGNAAQPNTHRASPCTAAKGNPRHDTALSEPQRKGADVTLRAVFLRRNPAARSPPALPLLSPAAKSCPPS